MSNENETNETPKTDPTKDMIPPGFYIGRAVYRDARDAVFGPSAQNNPQVGLSFVITEGDYKGRRYPWYGTLSGDALRITLDALEAAGATFGPDGTDLTDLTGFGTRDVSLNIVHKTVQKYESGALVDVIDEKTGEPRIIPQIAFVNPMGGARMSNVYDDAGLSSLRDMMRGALASRKKTTSGGADIPKDANGKPLF